MLQNILRECGLENRLEILKMLKDEGKTISGIKSQLRKLGVSKPCSTVGRYTGNLVNLGLLSEKDSRYYLTNLGNMIVHYFDELERNIGFLTDSNKLFEKFTIEYLPREVYHSLSALRFSETIEDPLTLITRILDMIESARSSIDILASDTSKEFAEHVLKKLARGDAGALLRANGSKIKVRILYPESVLPVLDLREIPKNIVGFDLRVFPDLKFHVFIVDSRKAILNLSMKDGSPHLNSGFASTDEDFISLAEEIFNHFWTRAVKLQ